MKKLFTLLAFVITIITLAQAPQGFNYQATVRNSSGVLISNQNVLFKFNIMLNSQTSLPIYSETHQAPTDDLGQVNLVIGTGTPTTGIFSSINWANGTYYLGIELNTGTGYVAMGTTQLLSVPYALYANSAGNSQVATPNLASVLAVNNGANNLQIKNLADPTDSQDAVTYSLLTTQIANLQAQITELQNAIVIPSPDLNKLAVPGNHQGWNPPTAPKIASTGVGLTDYEGYMMLNGGYKFLSPDASGVFNWGNTDWADDGSFSGVLAEQGESDCSSPAGYYRVIADTEALTYSTELTNWGIIGAATPGGWDASTPLTYNATTKMWEGIVALSAGEFKFRANDAWTINYGGDPAAMSQDGANLSVGVAGTYLVKLNLSSPRAYTYELIAQ